MTDTAYRTFLESKAVAAPSLGFHVELEDLHPWCKPHVKACVQWGLAGGSRAYFTAYGLHKTVMQLESCSQVLRRHGGEGLIVAPLGVRMEFMHDAEKLGIELVFIRSDAEIQPGKMHLTNYESVREGKVTPSLFTVASLDEADVLRSYGSKTFQEFLPAFEPVPFKFVASATPSPNRYKEIIHYAGFLGVMDTGQALTRFFQRNSEKANDLTLFPHKENEFWLWVSTWAVFLQKPSDLGFSDEGYELPELEVRWHEVPSDVTTSDVDGRGQYQMLKNAAAGVQQAAREKRDSLPARIAKLKELREAEPENHFILWHDLEDERRAIEAAVPAAQSVYGTQDLDDREAIIRGFKEGKVTDLAAKPVMLGAGGNLQRHCHRAIFAGIGHKFRDFAQAIHRIQRFGQTEKVVIDLIYSEAEREIRREFEAKWERDRVLRVRMAELIRQYGLNRMSPVEAMRRSIGINPVMEQGAGWTAVNNDCVDETSRMASDSVGLIVTSVPFGTQYEYCESYNDFGHNDDNAAFFRQMDFLTPELFRILQPGRFLAVHVKDRILFGAVTGLGFPTVDPFHADCIAHYRKHGFAFMAMRTIETDVVRENNQTYRLGYSEMRKDATKMGSGCPEYMLFFRKPQTDRSRGYADVPVIKAIDEYSLARWQVDAASYWRSSGDRLLTTQELASLRPDQLSRAFRKQSAQVVYDYEAHVALAEALAARDALPKTFSALALETAVGDVWTDIIRMSTLNKDQSLGGREKHVCLATGSEVLTASGFKPIESVDVGEMVLTHRGRWRPVTAKAFTGVRPCVTVRAHGVPGLTLTPDHKLWARIVPQGGLWDATFARRRALRAVPDWVRADQTLGSYLNLKLPPAEAETALSEDEWWIIGRWLGDGHLGARGEVYLSCGRHEAQALMGRLGWRAGTTRDTGTSVQIRVRDLGGVLRAVIAKCGRGAAGKQFPPEALALPATQAKALLDGYLSADGHYLEGRSRYMVTTVSKRLALGAALLFQRAYSAIASVYPGRPARKSEICGRAVDVRAEWIVSANLPTAGRRTKPLVLDDGAWLKVRSIEDVGEQGTWCLRVEEDESFTAEGCIVKNCPLQIDVVDRVIRLYSNPGDLVFDPFAGLFTVPVRALVLGRQGYGSELNDKYFADGIRYLREVEAGRRQVSMFDVIDAEIAA